MIETQCTEKSFQVTKRRSENQEAIHQKDPNEPILYYELTVWTGVQVGQIWKSSKSVQNAL
jgi:hypothetical protein